MTPPSQRRGSAAGANVRVWAAADAIVPAPLFPAPLGFPRAPHAVLEEAGPASGGRRMRCDRPRLAATAARSPEVPPFSLARASAREVGELPRKSSPRPPPAANMAVDSSMELLFLDTFKHPSAEVRLRDPIPTRPLSRAPPAVASGVVRALSARSRAGESSGPHPLPQPGASPVALGGGPASPGFALGPACSVESASLPAVLFLSCQHRVLGRVLVLSYFRWMQARAWASGF